MISLIRFLLRDGNEASLIFLSYEIMEMFLILFSICIFVIICSLDTGSKIFVSKMSLFCKNLPTLKKFFFLAFIFTFAIPNRVLFHNKINFWVQTLLNLFLFYLCFLFPWLFFIVLARVIFALESFIFATLCMNSLGFKKFIIETIFNGDGIFADEIFFFFWGNMTSSLKKFGSSMTAASALTFAYGEVRRNEQKVVGLEGQLRASNVWAEIIKDPKRIPTASSAEEYSKILKLSTEVARSETKILATEDAVKSGLISVFNKFL